MANLSPRDENGAPTMQERSNATKNLDRLLPVGYEPTPFDVICARGKHAKNHTGNRRFRHLIDMRLEEYRQADTKLKKSVIVSQIMDALQEGSPHHRGFIKVHQGRWYEATDLLAREKIGQSFRDLLHEEYKSSSKAKFTKRMKSRSSSTESFNRDTAASPDVQRSTSNQKSTSNTQSRSSIHDNANGLFVSHSPVHSSLVTHEMTASLPWPREDDGTTTSSPSPPPRRSMRESFVPPEWSSKLPSRQPENTSLSLPQPMYQGSSSSPSVLHRDLPIEEGQHSGRIGFLSAAASTLNRGSAFSIPYQPRNTSRGSMDVTSRLHSGSSPQSLNAEALQYGSKNEVARPNGEDIFRMIWGVSSTDNAAPKEFQPADATSSDAFEETAPSSPKVLAHPDGSPKVLLAGSAYELLYEPPTAQHPDLGNASIGSFDLSSHSTRAQNGNPQPKIHSSSSDESPRGHR